MYSLEDPQKAGLWSTLSLVSALPGFSRGAELGGSPFATFPVGHTLSRGSLRGPPSFRSTVARSIDLTIGAAVCCR